MMKTATATPFWIFGGLLLVLFQVYAQAPVQCPTPEPGAPPVLLPNPRNCSQYYICDGLNPIQMECPFPLVFDPTINGCNQPGLYQCVPTTDPPTDPPTTTQPMTTTTVPPPTDVPSEPPTDEPEPVTDDVTFSDDPEPISEGTVQPVSK